MSATIQQSEFTKGLLAVLSEAFESVRGFFLDPHTSLFETLSEITAAEASIPVGDGAPPWQRRWRMSTFTWKHWSAIFRQARMSGWTGAKYGAPFAK